jgi:predicted ATP-dependent endonuclease of OLD family
MFQLCERLRILSYFKGGLHVMGITIKDCKITNCGTGVKADGKVILDVNGLELHNNGKDIDLRITEDSIVNLEKVVTTGTKFESISIQTYYNGLDKVLAELNETKELSQDERIYITSKIAELKDTKEPKLAVKIIKEIKNQVKSISGQAIAQLIANTIMYALTNPR